MAIRVILNVSNMHYRFPLIMEWIAETLPKDTYVNIMAQYNPLYKAYDYPELSRRITREEYKKAVNKAKEMGLTNLDIQGYWLLQG
mgnify:CR=1 FL=1